MRPALIAVALATPLIAPAAAAGQQPAPPSAAPAVCQLILNERASGDLSIIVVPGDVWIAASDLDRLGLRYPAASARPAPGYVALSSLAPHVTGAFNERDVTLVLSATAAAFRAVTTAGAPTATAIRARPFSAFLNYATTVRSGGHSTVTGEIGVTMLRRFFVRTIVSGRPEQLVRRESSITFDDERRLIRWLAGDDYFVTPWTGHQRAFTGLSLSRNFRINPVFVTAGPLAFSGATAVPATAEVYLNGQLVRRTAIEPGAFELGDIAPTIGAGDVRLVVRDEFGRTTETTSSYYRSPRVLRRGLQEFRYTLGFLRAPISGRHDEAIATAQHRIGISRLLTAGGHFQATERGMNAESSVALQMPLGEFEVAGSASRVDRVPGFAGSAAYGYRGRLFDLQTLARWSSAQFTEVAAPAAIPVAARTTVGSQLTAEGSLGITLPRGIRVSASHRVASGTELRREATLFVTAAIRRTGLSVGGLVLERDGRRTWTGLGSLTVALGPRRSASTDAVAAAGVAPVLTVGLQESLPAGSGIGYRLRWQEATSSVSGAVEAQHPFGRADVRHDKWENGELTTATMAGAITFIAGSWHVTRPIDDAFALVRVRGVPGVRTYVSNQLVGRTDRRGELLLPALVSFLPTRVAIDDRDVPFALEIGTTESQVSPPFRGGSLVSFDVREIQRVSGRFVLPFPGTPEIVALADWNGRPGSVSVAHDGTFEFEHAEPGRYVIRVGGRGHWYGCTVTIAPPPFEALVAQRVGDVPCRAFVLPIARLR